MKRSTLAASLAAGLLALVAPTPTAQAAAQRSFVASYGVDAGNLTCSVVSPCRSFDVALANTNAGGEIVVLDSAGYGPVVIDKAIKIASPAGVYGGISVFAGDGIVVDAGDNDDVVLRGLDINGLGGTDGIDIINAGAVHIERTSISNFTGDSSACLRLDAAKTIRVYVNDSSMRACHIGVFANGSGGPGNRPMLLIDNTRLERAFNSGVSLEAIGLWVQNRIDATVRNSVISRTTIAIKFENAQDPGVSRLQVVDSYIGIADSAIAVANTGASDQARMFVDVIGSELAFMTSTAIDLNAANNSKIFAHIERSTIGNVTTALKTAGGAGARVAASIVRSHLHHADRAVDHGSGVVRLDGNHIVQMTNDLVDSGSGNIVSLTNNMLHDNDNSDGGLVYITPTGIAPK